MEIIIKKVADAEAAAAKFITASEADQADLWEYYRENLPPAVRGSLTAVAWQAEETESGNGGVLAFGWLLKWSGLDPRVNTVLIDSDLGPESDPDQTLLAQIEQEVLKQAESLLPKYK